MDSITHIVLGACAGEVILGKKIGKKAMLWGAIANSLPDIDAVVNFFVSDIDAILLHRGITHSLFTAMIFGPLLGLLFYKRFRRKGASLSQCLLLFTSGLVMHDLLDTCTIYGTSLALPFSDTRYTFANIFVADPLFTLPLLIASIALLIISTKNRYRMRWGYLGLGLSSMYMVWTFLNMAKAENQFELALQKKGVQMHEHFATPTLLNNILWNLVAKDSTGFWVGYYSILDSQPIPELHFIDKNEALLNEYETRVDIVNLKKFSDGYYCASQSEGKLWFNDMRFGQVRGWDDPNANFAFSFDLSAGADNSIVVQKGRMQGSKSDALKSLWTRIKGN